MNILNLGILAHVDAGKTTLTEAILHLSGAVRVAGRVDSGTTITDSMPVERERGITVRASTVSYEYGGVKVNILDTPGHMDFIAEVERALNVLDAAILVISAKEGVQTQTRKLYSALKSLNIPTVIFINKLDRAGADPDAVIKQINDSLTNDTIIMQSFSGEGGKCPSVKGIEISRHIEALVNIDDALLEKYVNEYAITDTDIADALKRAIASRLVCPVYFGAALNEIGVREIMDAISCIMPRAAGANDFSEIEVYKVERLPRLGRLCYARVWSGEVKRGEAISKGGQWRRVKQLMSPINGKLENVMAVPSGDIAVFCGMDDINIGDILTSGEAEISVRGAKIAEPMLYSKVVCEDSKRGEVLSALSIMTDEDPLLMLEISEITGEILLHIFGEVQMEIITSIMKERFNLAISLDEPHTIMREKPVGMGTGEISWGETHYQAALGMRIEPSDSEGIEYETEVDFGYLTKSFQAAIREAVIDSLRMGLMGWQVFGIKAILTWAHFSSVTSTPADFRNIAPLAIFKALKIAKTQIYEPYAAYTLKVPPNQAAKASFDVSTMRGTIESTYTEGDMLAFSGSIPIETSRSYPRHLASYTNGLGMIDFTPLDYRAYPYDGEVMARKGYDPANFEKYLLQKAGRL